MAIVIIFIFVNLMTYIFHERKPENLITNEHKVANQPQVFPSVPTTPPTHQKGFKWLSHFSV
jgi:hypothetical protein